MNKKLLIIAIVIGVLLTGAIAYVLATKMNSKTPATTSVNEPAPTPTQQTETPPAGPAQAQPGAYKDYDAATVANTKGTKILFFHAQWCPQCRQLDASIAAGPIPENVTIFKVNYDTAQDLRQKYGVTLQTTLVKIDDAGNLVKKYVAYDEPTLAALVKNLL